MTNPQTGDYGCIKIVWLHKKLFGRNILVPNLFGYLIRLFTFSRYDHAFVYVGNGKIVEAQPRGAILSEISKYNGDSMIWSQDSLTASQGNTIADKALSLRGIPYGFLDIVYLGLATIGFKFQWLLNKVEREDRLICSQLVALCGESAGIDTWLCGKANACLVTPANLAQDASSIKGAIS